MNKPITKKYFSAAIVIIVVIASFWLGGYIASNRAGESIYGVQANLAFRHLQAYEETYSYLNSGCASQAIVKLEFLINEQKMLMAEYVQSTYDSKFEEYVSLRNPKLLEGLRHHQVDWGKELIITGCNKQKE